VHFEGLSNADLIPFKSILPYTFTDLSVGFKYLGYLLKTGVYRADDWNWLVTKMEKKYWIMVQQVVILGWKIHFIKVSFGESADILDVFGDHSPLCIEQDSKTYVQFPLEWSQRNSTTSSLQVGSSF